MKTTKILSAALAILMALVLIACKSAARNSSENNPTPVPDTVQTQISEHLDQINTILNGHADLWDKLFAQSDDTANQVFEDRSVSKYLELLLEKHKELITDDERNALAGDIEKICGIEDALEKLYAALPEESDNRQNGDAEKSTESVSFPAFEGKDLDGNAVSSKTLFAANKVTVVNFWFSGCSPCVEELDELNALNEKLKEKGGAVIGINTDTLNGDESQIAEAKKLLAQKGAAYPNIWFDKDSEAGQFSNNLLRFPTTYVVDSNGQIVGQPILGSVDELGVTELLWAQIYAALEEDPIFY